MLASGSSSRRRSLGSRLARSLGAVALIVAGAGVVPASGWVAVAAAEPASPTASTTPAAAIPSDLAALDGVRRTDRVVIRWATTARTPRLVAARVAALGSPTRLDAVSAAAGEGARFVRSMGRDGTRGVYRLAGPLGADASTTMAAIGAIPGVESVEPDVWVTTDALPNDPYSAQLWGLLGAANGSPYGIDAVTAWNTSRGAGVTVAVIDTGLLAHPDLAGQTVAGYDFVSDPAMANDGGGRDADPSDPGDWVSAADVAGRFAGCTVTGSSWHGTHVAGTIAAVAGNGIGVFGAAPDSRVQAVRALGKCGGYLSDISDGIVWAAGGAVSGAPANATPARVLNLSLGSAAACPSYAADAIRTARSLGAVVVVAAGNAGANASTSTPANCPGAFVVAATRPDGTKASFSNYGAIVDIAAPGTTIWSTLNAGTTVPAAMGYAAYQGTSMATPHVASTAALLAAAAPDATNDEIEAAIRGGATAFPGTCSGCGAGIANVPRALEALTAGANPSPTEPPPADTTPPVASVPSAQLRSRVPLSGTSIPLTLRWSGTDEIGGSGIDHFELARSTDGGTTWTTVSHALAVTSTALVVASTGSVRFRVRAVDTAGNQGEWMAGPVLAPRLIQQTTTALRWSGRWASRWASAYSGGSDRFATARSASVSYTFTGRGIAVVTTRAARRGKVSIYIDGRLATTADLRRSVTQYRSVAWGTTWSTSRTRTIRVVVAGTGGRPRVDIDAFIVLR